MWTYYVRVMFVNSMNVCRCMSVLGGVGLGSRFQQKCFDPHPSIIIFLSQYIFEYACINVYIRVYIPTYMYKLIM